MFLGLCIIGEYFVWVNFVFVVLCGMMFDYVDVIVVYLVVYV